MHINDRSKTDFDRAKIKLTGHFDRRPTGRYIEPWMWVLISLDQDISQVSKASERVRYPVEHKK